jgi:hypothetical protein
LLKKSIPAIAPALLYLPPSMAVAWLFSTRQAKSGRSCASLRPRHSCILHSMVIALLHFSLYPEGETLTAFEKWQYIPVP